MSKPQASDLPAPFQFNAWKHHMTHVKIQLPQLQHRGELQKRLLALGQSVMDIYTGNLTLPEVQEALTIQLQNKRVLGSHNYQDWLSPDGYNFLSIADQSRWIMRLGETPVHYVHLHPARYSPHSFRIKANLWKTAIVLAWQNTPIDLKVINQARKDFLQLSPVKSVEPGLLALVNLLRQV